MCVAVPVEVIEIMKNKAIIKYGGVKSKVDISLVEDLNIGDYVLIHAGCAIEKIDYDEAQKTLELFKLLCGDDI
jgi:hydrogenase expression/formation protein HypC